jgi:hypothetical protein
MDGGNESIQASCKFMQAVFLWRKNNNNKTLRKRKR